MDVLVAYDVAVETPTGQRRLRKVAEACLAYGQRVQQSVFECSLTEPSWNCSNTVFSNALTNSETACESIGCLSRACGIYGPLVFSARLIIMVR